MVGCCFYKLQRLFDPSQSSKEEKQPNFKFGPARKNTESEKEKKKEKEKVSYLYFFFIAICVISLVLEKEKKRKRKRNIKREKIY